MSGDTLSGLLILMILVLVGVIPLAWLKFRHSHVEEEDPRIPPHALHQLNQRINQDRIDHPDRQS